MNILKAKWCYYGCGSLNDLNNADFDEAQKIVYICDTIEDKKRTEMYEFWAKLFGGKK